MLLWPQLWCVWFYQLDFSLIPLFVFCFFSFNVTKSQIWFILIILHVADHFYGFFFSPPSQINKCLCESAGRLWSRYEFRDKKKNLIAIFLSKFSQVNTSPWKSLFYSPINSSTLCLLLISLLTQPLSTVPHTDGSSRRMNWSMSAGPSGDCIPLRRIKTEPPDGEIIQVTVPGKWEHAFFWQTLALDNVHV